MVKSCIDLFLPDFFTEVFFSYFHYYHLFPKKSKNSFYRSFEQLILIQLQKRNASLSYIEYLKRYFTFLIGILHQSNHTNML